MQNEIRDLFRIFCKLRLTGSTRESADSYENVTYIVCKLTGSQDVK